MTEGEKTAKDAHPVLLCFDGSNDAATAIAKAGELLGPRAAVVLTVWEPAALWVPYDPATILTAPLSKLASKELGLDEIAHQAARETSDRGVTLARAAGFEVRGSVAKGKSWRAICDEAGKLDAEPIVWVPVACRVSSRRSLAACRMPSSCTRTARCSSSRAAESLTPDGHVTELWHTGKSHPRNPTSRCLLPVPLAAESPCIASELAAGALTCELAGWAGCGKIAVCVPSPALPHHDPGLRLAGDARPHPGIQRRGNHVAPS